MENIIERLKKDVKTSSQEVKMLHRKLSLIEVHLGATDTRLRQVKCKADERGFDESKALAM